MTAWWAKLLLGAGILVIPGAMLLLPLLIAYMRRQRARRQEAVVRRLVRDSQLITDADRATIPRVA